MARFFIDRPVFAWVLAILTMLAGVMSLFNLPVSQYPTISMRHDPLVPFPDPVWSCSEIFSQAPFFNNDPQFGVPDVGIVNVKPFVILSCAINYPSM